MSALPDIPPVVAAGEDRNGRPFRFLNGTFTTKVSSRDGSGGLAIFDSERFEPGGPPVHVHSDVDEWFHVTEGEFVFLVGDSLRRLGPGDSILGPRGIPHAFASISPTARLMIVFQPAGTMEAFFEEGSRIGPMSPEDFAALSARHGMTVTGGPLDTVAPAA